MCQWGENQFKWNSKDIGSLNQGARRYDLSSADQKDVSGLPSCSGFKGIAFPSPPTKAVSGLKSARWCRSGMVPQSCIWEMCTWLVAARCYSRCCAFWAFAGSEASSGISAPYLGISLEFKENPWGNWSLHFLGELPACVHGYVTVLCVTKLFCALRSHLKYHVCTVGFFLGLRKSELTSLYVFLFTYILKISILLTYLSLLKL